MMPSEISEVLFVVGGAFVVAAFAIFIAGCFPAGRKTASELWAVYRSEFLLVGALLVPAALGAFGFALFLALLAWRGQIELGRLFALTDGNTPQNLSILVGAAAILLVALGHLAAVPAILIGGVLLVAGGGFFVSADARLRAVGIPAAGLIFPVLCCVLALLLHVGPQGFVWIAVAYATVEINDSVALLAGKIFGTKRIFPRLSPGKTAEGLAAGLVLGGFAGTALAYSLLDLSLPLAAALSVCLLSAGLAGDLGTSALKRARGQKDFAPVLKRHGGVLDIYDSFLVAAPAAYLFRMTLGV